MTLEDQASIARQVIDTGTLVSRPKWCHMTWRATSAGPYVRGGPGLEHAGECEDEGDAGSAASLGMNTTNRRSRMEEELAALNAKKALMRTTGRVHNRDKASAASVSIVGMGVKESSSTVKSSAAGAGSDGLGSSVAAASGRSGAPLAGGSITAAASRPSSAASSTRSGAALVGGKITAVYERGRSGTALVKGKSTGAAKRPPSTF
jgi:hypothetical protein